MAPSIPKILGGIVIDAVREHFKFEVALVRDVSQSDLRRNDIHPCRRPPRSRICMPNEYFRHSSFLMPESASVDDSRSPFEAVVLPSFFRCLSQRVRSSYRFRLRVSDDAPRSSVLASPPPYPHFNLPSVRPQITRDLDFRNGLKTEGDIDAFFNRWLILHS